MITDLQADPTISRWTTTCEECGAVIRGESKCYLCPGAAIVGGAWSPIVGACECGHVVVGSDADWTKVTP